MRGRQDGKKHGIRNCRDAPANGPSTLHGADGFAAVFRADGFTHQHRADRPLAAEAQALQPAGHQQLPEGVGEPAEEGEDREPQDGDLQDAHPAEAVGKQSREPSAKRRNQQRSRAQHARLSFADVPGGDQRGNDEAVDHHVHAVQRPAAEGCDQRAAFLRREVEDPELLTSALSALTAG